MKLLIVEDNEHDAYLLQATLKRAGIECDFKVARTRADYLEALDEAPDIVLLDFSLRGFEALEALDLAAARSSESSFIVVSGSVGDEMAAECIRRGASDYILKDRLGRLPQAVRMLTQRRQLLNAAQKAEDKHRALVERIPAVVYSAKPGMAGEWLYCSPHISNLLGFTSDEWMERPELWHEQIHAQDRQGVLDSEERALSGGHARTIEYRMFMRDGRMRWIRDESVLDVAADGTHIFNGLLFDITEDRRVKDLIAHQARILEMIARGADLDICLTASAAMVESVSEGCRCAIGLLDEGQQTLVRWVSSTISSDFLSALEGSAGGSGGGTSGTAAELRRGVFSTDIARDELWLEHREPARLHGLAASWSVPILSGDQMRVLGTFDTYYAESRDPSLEDLETVDQAIRLAAIAIEHERAGSAIRAGEARKSAVLEASLDCIITIDHEGRVLEFNPAAERTFGYSRDEAIGQEVAELIVPVRLQKAHRDGLARHASMQGNEPVAKRVELPARRKDGTEFLCEIAITQVNVPGKPIFTAFLRDISERSAMQSALTESEALFRSAFSASRSGVVLAEPNGRYMDVNPAFCEMLGYSRDELLQMDWVTLTHPDDRTRNIAEAMELIEGRADSMLVTKRYTHKSGRTIWAETSDAVVRDPDGEALYIVAQVQDITERHEAQRERERLQEQLRQSQKMEALGQLAGGVAHDFNNLLSVVINYADFISAALGPDHECRDDVDEIRGAGERAALLVRQLLAFSRKEVIRVKPLDLRKVVQGLHELMRRTLGEHIVLAVEEASGPISSVCADPGQMEQILMNLAVNARDAMESGGRMIISTSNVTVGPDFDLHPDLPHGPYVRLVVADTGVGIAPEVADHIFEPFFTTKPRGEGTGLGLATVYGIVQQAGGQISVDSTLGQGTSFNVYLPAATDEAEDSQPLPRPQSGPKGGGSILVVEDEDGVRKVVERVLVNAGYEVVSAPSGQEAIDLLDQGVTPDLILTDVIMPGMSGKSLVDLVRKRGQGIPVLYMSGYADDIIANRGALNESVEFIQKPFTAEQILLKVQDLFNRKAVA